MSDQTFDLYIDRQNGIAIAVINGRDSLVSQLTPYYKRTELLSNDDVSYMLQQLFPHFLPTCRYIFKMYQTGQTSRDGIVMFSDDTRTIQFSY